MCETRFAWVVRLKNGFWQQKSDGEERFLVFDFRGKLAKRIVWEWNRFEQILV